MDPVSNIYFGKPVGDTTPEPETTPHTAVVKPDPDARRAEPGATLKFVPGQGLKVKPPASG